MSSFFHYRWQRNGVGNALVLVTTLPSFGTQDLIRIIDEDRLGGRPFPDSLIIVVPSDAAAAARASVKKSLQAGTELRLANALVPVVIASFDARGRMRISPSSVLQGSIDLADEDFRSLKASGIAYLAATREAVLVAPSGHHFVHPRRRHSAAFFRAANMLIQGEEIGLLSLVLLPYLYDSIKKIWVDSSSISALVFASYSLKSRLKRTFITPRVTSFSSYEGLEKLSIQDPDSELVVISATATGSLPKQVIEQTKLPPNHVITLFSTAQQVPGAVVFDSRDEIQGLDPLSLEVFEQERCPWCRDGSRTITFVGDQFLADAATVTAYTLVQTDAPPQLRDVMRRYRGKRAFSLRRDPDRDVHRLFVDLDRTLLSDGGKEAIEIVVRRHAPASTSHVLALGGNDGLALAERVADEIQRLGLRRPYVMRGPDLETGTDDRRGVIVVAASVGSGQSFQDASRDLRDRFKEKPRTFLAGLRKHSAAEHQLTLLRDLEHNNQSPKHTMCFVDDIMLPHPNQFTAWSSEFRFWNQALLRLRISDTNDGAVTAVEGRISAISANVGGDDLFLKTSSGGVLKLRQGFAFWTGSYEKEDITQGDVFATIAAILENCRKLSRPKQTSAPLSQSPFHLNVLSSENFTRYNDGIIQAALLRASFPHELNFADVQTEKHSSKIANLIVKMLRHHNESQGEACIEFLLALATKRLTLAEADIKRIAAAPREGLSGLLSIALSHAVGETDQISDPVDLPA
ncbi:conserved hypothetical protein [Mesorhizobium plurifarium]|uniref:Uncharacterized protein n=1 Tax=Mesorhizobium plurifarium TaxID=69974 RepID=A0A090G3G3_MESPL|nr:conserved hypothetical protein [Mesorhizobium plurifarium]